MNKDTLDKLKELIEKVDSDKEVFKETRDLIDEYSEEQEKNRQK